MNSFSSILLALALTLIVGCASAPPLPSQASFTQQILDPLSSQIADQKIDQRKAEIDSGRLNLELMGTLGGLIAPLFQVSPPVGSTTGSVLGGLLNSSIEHDLALLESRRPAVKQEILTLYQQRTKRIENGFAVCVEGQERQYLAEQGSFTRSLTDGPGPCEQTPLKSLRLP